MSMHAGNKTSMLILVKKKKNSVDEQRKRSM